MSYIRIEKKPKPFLYSIVWYAQYILCFQPLAFHFGDEVSKAIDHHRGLCQDAEDDAGDIHLHRNKVVGEEIPHHIDSKRNIYKGTRHQSWVILKAKEKKHYNVSEGVQSREIGCPQTPLDAVEVRNDARQRAEREIQAYRGATRKPVYYLGRCNLHHKKNVNNTKAAPVIDAAFIVIRRLFLWR